MNFGMLITKIKVPRDNEGWVVGGADDVITNLKNGPSVLKIGAERQFCTYIMKIMVSSSHEGEEQGMGIFKVN